MEASFQAWISTLAVQVIAIDGKTIKDSYDRETSIKALQMVSAWTSKHQLVLGQSPVDAKSNEITAIPVLLEQLNLAGCIVTLDAMGTQSAIAQQIYQAQVDYILALTANHTHLYQQAQQWFEHHRVEAMVGVAHTHHQQTENGHHRVKFRSVWQFPVAQVFTAEQQSAWSNLQSFVVVHTTRRLWDQNTSEVRFFLSSLQVNALIFARYICTHWGIENQLHWCLDVAFSEDASRIHKDHVPHNVILHRLALNLLRQELSKASLTIKWYRAGLEDSFMVQILPINLSRNKAQPDT